MPGLDFFDDEEKNEVLDVLESTCMFRYNHEHLRNDKWKARELETAVKNYTGAKYAHAVSSGSTAVTTMLASCGVGYGDEVIVPPFTYVAPIESVLWAGSLPVFADIDETLCLNAQSIESVITPKTKAVLLVHMCGAAADIDSIIDVCNRHNIKLIEDAGQAMGAFYKGKSVGLFGEMGTFSFDFFKITTMGEGGMIITNKKKLYHLSDQISDHGHDHVGENRGMENHPVLGANFRISELHAAIGLAQMRKINKIRDAKKTAKAYIKSCFSNIKGVTFRNMESEEGDSGTFLNFFLENTEMAQKVHQALSKHQIAGFNYWYTNMYHFINQWNHIKELKFPSKLVIHELGAPQDYSNLDLPEAQNVIGRLISLGIKANWTEDEYKSIAKKSVEIIESTISKT